MPIYLASAIVGKTYDRPYTGTAAPRETRLVGEAKKKIVSATSPVVGHIDGSASGIARRFAGVSMIEGTTALTQIPSPASSSDNDIVSASTAALEAA